MIRWSETLRDSEAYRTAPTIEAPAVSEPSSPMNCWLNFSVSVWK